MFYGQSFLSIIIIELILFSLAYVLSAYSFLWTVELFLALGALPHTNQQWGFQLISCKCLFPLPTCLSVLSIFFIFLLLGELWICQAAQEGYRMASFLKRNVIFLRDDKIKFKRPGNLRVQNSPVPHSGEHVPGRQF